MMNIWICLNVFVEINVKVRDRCNVTGNYTCAAYRDCKINVGRNFKNVIVFHNLKN